MKTYLFVYFGSTLLALLITPAVIWLTRRHSIVAIPGNRHMHKKPISHIGGIAIFFSTIFLTIPVLFLSNNVGLAFRDIFHKVIILFCVSGFMFLIGLIDDIRKNGLRARVKLLAQIFAALIICTAGIRIETIAVTKSLILDFGWFSWPLTLLWIIGITNAVNLSDGLDGLAAGISAITCGAIVIFSIYSGNVVMAVLMLALLGSLTGFLFFNFNPAKIFMGDCGSMFLGFIIASTSVLCSMKTTAIVGLALPIVALGIPIFDTLFSILRRFLERRSIFAADRSHFHHRLVDFGFKQRHAVMIMYLITLVASGLGMLMMVLGNGASSLIFFGILIMIVYLFHIVGAVRLRKTFADFKRNYKISKSIQNEIRKFEDSQLYFRQADNFKQWWQAVTKTAEKMDFSNLSLPLTNRDGSTYTLCWFKNNQNIISDDILKINLPIQDRRSGPKLNLKIEVFGNKSLESAGRRIALFTRLMDENDVTTLQQ